MRKFTKRVSIQIAIALLLAFGSVHTVAASDPVRVVKEELKSELVKTTLPYNVILPRDYLSSETKNKRYPVIYLLHGLGGHYSDWHNRTKLADYSRQYEILIVTPEGNDGWYTDSATLPANKYESYIVDELIPEVDRKFRTIQSREARAIAGLSMGGYGALKFAIKHPEKFILAGSMSGALDAANWTESDLKGFAWIWKTLTPVFGAPASSTRSANDILKLYRELPAVKVGQLPFLYLDCGTEDPLLNSTRKLAEVLLERKIPFQVRLLPGKHGWQYWDQQVVEILRLAGARMAPANLAATQSSSASN